MNSLNTVLLAGNLTRDPELRTTRSGSPVTQLGVAINESYRNAEGEQVERTCFADVDVWGKQAEACCRYLAKGRPVLVEGKLQLDQWQTDSGERRQRLKVRALRVHFIGGSPGQAAADTPAASAAPAQEPALA